MQDEHRHQITDTQQSEWIEGGGAITPPRAIIMFDEYFLWEVQESLD